jgi:iron complex transport system substrate-binding protein
MFFGINMLLSTPALAEKAWPRVFVNSDGSKVTINQPPQRILSTSVSVTGTLLAIDAPVIASSTNYNGKFFSQWQKIAENRKVEKLWSIAEVDIESAYSVKPDLIIVAVGGRDSAVQYLNTLRKVAPILLVDYASQSWQSLALKLAEAIGIENQAQQKINEFDRYVNLAKQQMIPPKGMVNIIGYNGPGLVNPIATPFGSHGSLLTSLGFKMESPDLNWHSAIDKPDDFVKSEYERLTELKAQTTFLLRFDDSAVPRFMQDKILANLPSVKKKQVYGLGKNSFRIDYFSAKEIISEMLKRFGKPSN